MCVVLNFYRSTRVHLRRKLIPFLQKYNTARGCAFPSYPQRQQCIKMLAAGNRIPSEIFNKVPQQKSVHNGDPFILQHTPHNFLRICNNTFRKKDQEIQNLHLTMSSFLHLTDHNTWIQNMKKKSVVDLVMISIHLQTGNQATNHLSMHSLRTRPDQYTCSDQIWENEQIEPKAQHINLDHA